MKKHHYRHMYCRCLHQHHHRCSSVSLVRRWALCHLYCHHHFRGRRRRRHHHHHRQCCNRYRHRSRHQHRHFHLVLCYCHRYCYLQRLFVTVIVMGLIIIVCRRSGNWIVVFKLSLWVHRIWIRIERNIGSLRLNLVVWTWLGRRLKYPITNRKLQASVNLCWTLKEKMAISAKYWKGNGRLLFRTRLLEICFIEHALVARYNNTLWERLLGPRCIRRIWDAG